MVRLANTHALHLNTTCHMTVGHDLANIRDSGSPGVTQNSEFATDPLHRVQEGISVFQECCSNHGSFRGNRRLSSNLSARGERPETVPSTRECPEA